MDILVVCRYIRGEAERSSHVRRDVGNVMIDTEITFEYGVRTKGHDHRGMPVMPLQDNWTQERRIS